MGEAGATVGAVVVPIRGAPTTYQGRSMSTQSITIPTRGQDTFTTEGGPARTLRAVRVAGVTPGVDRGAGPGNDRTEDGITVVAAEVNPEVTIEDPGRRAGVEVGQKPGPGAKTSAGRAGKNPGLWKGQWIRQSL